MNWARFTSISNDVQQKQKFNNENQDIKYETIIQPVSLYGSECWTVQKEDETSEMIRLRIYDRP